MKASVIAEMQARTREMFERCGIAINPKEEIEVSDFGLNDIENVGLQLVVYINTERVCAKEMVLFPGQTCPEHMHVGSGNMPGKEETFRCRYGKVYLYVAGEGDKKDVKGNIPPTDTTVYHEVILLPGEQYTIMPGTLHWFQGGEDGAVVSEFSTMSTDETDVFTDKRIVRKTVVEE